MSTFPAPKKSKFPLKWLLLGVIAGVAIYYGAGAFTGGAPKDQAAAAGAMPANVAEVIARPVTEWREFSGRLEAVNAAEIRPQVNGQIVGVHFKDGQDVKRGQALFTIDPKPFEAEVARARGQMLAAKSVYENTAQDNVRAGKLVKTKSISRAEYERTQSLAAQAAGNYEAAKGALVAAEVNLGYAHVTAPIAGRISRAEITLGNLVQAGPGAPLLASIVTVSPLYASFEIDEHTFLSAIQGVPAAKLKTVPVEVGMANEQGTPMKATIHSFDNQIAPGSGTIRVRALVPNTQGTLMPGLFARARIGSPDPVDSVLINPMTVGTDQNKKFVMAVNAQNQVEYREIKLGGMSDGLQIVTEGLKPGERIVVSGLQRLRPGMPITPVPSDMMTTQPLAASEAPAADAAQPTAGTEQ